MFVELIKKYDGFSEEELEEDDNVITGEELGAEYFDKFLTRSELVYHKYLMCAPISSLFLRNPIIVGGSPSNLKIPCNIGHVHVGKAYIDLNSPINIMTRMQYNWIMRKQLEPREDPESLRGISNFTGRVRGMHIFVGNFTYVLDFVIVEDIRIVKFINGADEIAYKMPHKIEQFEMLSDMEKEHKQSVYFRNEDDKRREVDYVMNKILGFYKECLELGSEYLTGLEGSGSGNSASECDNRVCPIVNALAGRLLGSYDLRVVTPRAVVHANDKTSRDARSWYMISGDAKYWVCVDKGKWMVLDIKDMHP
ncbi:hypothetical protein Tco_0792705 [Tanacetum coccineum]